MIQTQQLNAADRNKLWFKTTGYVIAFTIATSIVYYLLFCTIPLPSFVIWPVSLISGTIGIFGLRYILLFVQDVIADKQLVMSGLVQRKWSKADYRGSESNQNVFDTYNIELLINSSNLTITKSIDAKTYNKILEGDEVQIISLEYSKEVLDISITKTASTRNFTINQTQNNSSQILQTLHTEPLTDDELALAKEDIILYRIGFFIFSIIPIALSIMLWHKQKTINMTTFSFNKELFICAIAVFPAITLLRKYLQRNRDFRNAYKNVLIARVHKKNTIANDGLDSFQLLVKSDAVDGQLNFNIRQQADFDKIVVHDIIKIDYLERTKLVFRVEILQAAQR